MGILCLSNTDVISFMVLHALFILLKSELALHVTLDSVQSCRHDSWKSLAKYLVEDVPLRLKLEDLKDVQKVLSMIFKSPPADLREFIRWVAEVRRQENGSVIVSEEEKGRVAIKVFYSFFEFLFSFLIHYFLFSVNFELLEDVQEFYIS
jgi:hypothetical protein